MANINLLNITTTLNEVSEVASIIWEKGWAERNAGNFSINCTQETGEISQESQKIYSIDNSLPLILANHSFFVTGSGKRLRDLVSTNKIGEHAAIIRIDRAAKGYYIIWGGESVDFKPTSELISHLLIHADLLKRGVDKKAVLHTHPLELIALSHSLQHCQSSRQLTNYLWRMLPEVRAFVPRGVALVPYVLPGSLKLGELTVAALQKYDVALWQKHGAIAIGANIIDAFDFIDVANKGAALFLQCLNAGFMPVGMTDIEIAELEKAFNLCSDNKNNK